MLRCNAMQIMKGLLDQDALPDHRLLIVDLYRCQFCQRLLDELKLARPSKDGQGNVLYFFDMGRLGPSELDRLAASWMPGVPCLVSDGSVHLGVDAFNKCREFARSVEGLVLQELHD